MQSYILTQLHSYIVPEFQSYRVSCKICDFKSTSKHGVDVHTVVKHKQEDQSEPEVLRIAEVDNSLDVSEVSEKRDESIIPSLASSTLTILKKILISI